MASIYKRKRSPFWWLKFRDTDNIIKRVPTPFRIGIGPDTRRAEQLSAEKTLQEKTVAPGGVSKGWDWVQKFINSKPGRTKERYNTAWRTLSKFLKQHKITTPVQLRRDHCIEYFEWREKPDVSNGKYNAGRNTALLEMKILGAIMKEAVHRDYIESNPCRELGIKRKPRREWSEYTDKDIQLILNAIKTEPKPACTQLHRSFLVAMYHGVRLNETNVNPMTDVQLWKEGAVTVGSIRFKQKGGKVKTKPLHPQLISLFEELRADGSKETYPKLAWGNRWTKFLRRSGIRDSSPNATFHSLRVTVKSRLRRAGIGKELAMEYLSHEAADVDESYNRYTLEDLRECHAALDFHLDEAGN